MKYLTFSCWAVLCLTLGLAIGCGSSKEEPERPQVNSDTVSQKETTVPQEAKDAADIPPTLSGVSVSQIGETPTLSGVSVSEIGENKEENKSEVVPETDSKVPTTPEIQPEMPEPALPEVAPPNVENNAKAEAVSETATEVKEDALPKVDSESNIKEDTLPETDSEKPAPTVPEVAEPVLSDIAVPEVETTPEITTQVKENPVPDTDLKDSIPAVPPVTEPALPESKSEKESTAQDDKTTIQLDDMNLAETPNSDLESAQKTPPTVEPVKKNEIPQADLAPATENEPVVPTVDSAQSKETEEVLELKMSEGALQENPNENGRVLPPPPNRKSTASQADTSVMPALQFHKQDVQLEAPPQTEAPEIKIEEEPVAQEPVVKDPVTSVPAVQVPAVQETVQANPKPNEIVKAPFDPVKENGPIFVGWDKPLVALVITGQQNGYLEPCGCAGLDRMKGGLSRRYTFMQEMRAKGWPVVAMDVGGMCNSFGKQAELKFHTTASALRAMGYDAIALGKAEIGFPAADILSEVVNADGTPGMFVSCNVSIFERDANMPPTYKIIEAGGLKFGITSALCKSAQSTNQNGEILLSSTGESLNKVISILKEKSDIRILLSHGTVEEATIIAKDFPDFQVIVTAGGNPEPPSKPVILPSGQYLITVGEKGMCSIVLGFFESGVLKYQRVPHDSRFASSPEVRQMMQSYQDQLKQLWLAGLGIRAVPQTDPARGANVGPKKCETCHEYQYDIWKKSKHAHAFHSLETATPPRDFDPECVCCHVVGWHRHLYFPYQKGYMEPGKDDYLKNVSCEACHGPGEAHIAAESSSDTANQKAQRAKLHIDLKYAKEKMCGDCHDLDNSPDFDPDKYWNLIQHKEPDDEQ